MKVFPILKYTFGVISLVLLGGAYFLYQNTQEFLGSALSAQGSVIELARSYSSDSITYAPVVEFTTRNGQAITFTSSTSSNPPSYSVGESVEVFYQENEPRKARINGFFSLWGASTILAGIGSVFFLTGTGIIIAERRKQQKIAELRRSGISIQAKIQNIEINHSTKVNGKSPYVIHAQWQNPATGEIHVFDSDNIWFDPTDFVRSDEISVLIDRQNPSKYHMDISFLPKLAD